MKTIQATYQIVTPMFIGGANQDPSDGIRPPSFKGALRFWWRALNWGKFYQDNDGTEAAALKALHTEECRLFGSAVKGEQGGQGCFLLSIEQPQNLQEDNRWPQAKPIEGSGYLGVGLWESGSKNKANFQAHRKSIYSKSAFKVTLRLKHGAEEKQLLEALKMLGLFGGLGSRSRRGFGSISLVSLQGENFACASHEQYAERMKEVLPHQTCEIIPPFTAWSELSRVGMLNNPSKDAKAAHKQAAQLFYKVRGKKAEVRGENKRGFGQPLPLKPKRDEHKKRRASPLFFHIHPVGEQYTCSHIFMPAQFLPQEGYDMDFFSGVNKYMSHLQEVSL